MAWRLHTRAELTELFGDEVSVDLLQGLIAHRLGSAFPTDLGWCHCLLRQPCCTQRALLGILSTLTAASLRPSFFASQDLHSACRHRA